LVFLATGKHGAIQKQQVSHVLAAGAVPALIHHLTSTEPRMIPFHCITSLVKLLASSESQATQKALDRHVQQVVDALIRIVSAEHHLPDEKQEDIQKDNTWFTYHGTAAAALHGLHTFISEHSSYIAQAVAAGALQARPLSRLPAPPLSIGGCAPTARWRAMWLKPWSQLTAASCMQCSTRSCCRWRRLPRLR
jgi:hypothetical protein